MEIRNASVDDAKRLLEIYDHYVKNTAISFECETPSIDEFKARIERITKKYPYFVAVKDKKIIGYAYAAPFITRAAYDWSCELTIYIDKDKTKCGAGKMLYNAIERTLIGMGITNMYACIGYTEKEDEYLTNNSANFHAHMGFTLVGTFKKCGRKFDRWYDMIYMEKIIGEHTKEKTPISDYRN